jgi:hypothetical protein
VYSTNVSRLIYCYFIFIPFRDNTLRTPRSAARQNEHNERHLDSPQHRRIPERHDITPIPLALPNVNMRQSRMSSDISDSDPFHVASSTSAMPMEPSPTTAINALADLRAQASAASALLRPVHGYRRRRQFGHEHIQNNLINSSNQTIQSGNQPSIADLHAAANLIPHPIRNNMQQHILITPPPPPPPLPAPLPAPSAPLPLAQHPFNSNPN